MNDLRYQAGDAFALGTDEQVVLDLDTPAPALNARKLLSFALAGAWCSMIVTAFIVQALPIPVPRIVIAVIFCSAFAGAIVLARGWHRSSHRITSVRLTGERLIRRSHGRSVQLSFDRVHRFTMQAAPKTALLSLHVQQTPLALHEIGKDDETNNETTRRVAGWVLMRALSMRGQSRAARRALRPAQRIDTWSDVSNIDASLVADLWFAPLDGEVVLWSGRPVRSIAATLRHRLDAMLRSTPWIASATAAVVVPIVCGWLRDPDYAVGGRASIVIGIVVAVIWFLIQVVVPISDWRRLGNTSYVLRTQRLIRHSIARGNRVEDSLLFDEASTIRLELNRFSPGCGTVRIDASGQLESIADAVAVHAIAVRAVARARAAVAPTITALPVAPPAV